MIALYNLYFQHFLTMEPEKKALRSELPIDLGEAYQRDISMSTGRGEDLYNALAKMITMFESGDTHKTLKH